MNRTLLTGAAIILAASVAWAQPKAVRQLVKDAKNGNAIFVSFVTTGANDASNGARVLKEFFKTGANVNFRALKTETDELGYLHVRFQEQFMGIPIEHGNYVVHARNGEIESMGGDFKAIADDFNARPALGPAAALESAKAFVGARQYVWETDDADMYYDKINGTFQPKAELVIVGNFRSPGDDKLHLAYKFDIYAAEPLSRQTIYVDAFTGDILLANARIHHTSAPGSFKTRYSGTQSSLTDKYSGSYRLRDYTRGQGVETYNLRQGVFYFTAVEFKDANNQWVEYHNTKKDDAALDAHLGAQNTYDYFKNVHNRLSYDNANSKIQSYVHYSKNYVNAFWNGSVMTYGDGDGVQYDPLTSQDVCSHEIGHGVCENTANLVYSGESGAMNEGLSDIWGACVEYYKFPTKKTWYVGDDFDLINHKGFRNMANPNEFSDPDTYLGTYWYTGTGDNGGVHTNSGVLNYWFYLLTNGGSGTNDIGNAFSVQGIGITDAAKITYRMESVYMTANTDYAGARTYAIQAAQDLFGVGSQQEKSVTNAFYAVGIGAAYPAAVASALAPPTNLANVEATERSFSVSWSPVLNAKEYTVEIWNGNRWDVYATTQDSKLVVNSVERQSMVTWRVVARDKTGNSAESLSKLLDLSKPFGRAVRPAALSINLYPNPSAEVMRISYTTEQAGEVQVLVTDVMGRALIQRVATVQPGSNNLDYSVRHLTRGSYVVKLTELPANAEPVVHAQSLLIEN